MCVRLHCLGQKWQKTARARTCMVTRNLPNDWRLLTPHWRDRCLHQKDKKRRNQISLAALGLGTHHGVEKVETPRSLIRMWWTTAFKVPRFCPSKIETIKRAEPLFKQFSQKGIGECDLPKPEPLSKQPLFVEPLSGPPCIVKTFHCQVWWLSWALNHKRIS